MWAFYETSGLVDCTNTTGAIEVTTDPSTNWSSSNIAVATVNNTTDKGRVTGVSGGTTNITATYRPNTTTYSDAKSVTVTCIPTLFCSDPGPAATAANKCSGDTFVISDGCSGLSTCTGTRTCDFNWKEVGQ